MSKLKIRFGRTGITPPNVLFISGYYSKRRGQGCLDDLKASVLAFTDGENYGLKIHSLNFRVKAVMDSAFS